MQCTRRKKRLSRAEKTALGAFRKRSVRVVWNEDLLREPPPPPNSQLEPQPGPEVAAGCCRLRWKVLGGGGGCRRVRSIAKGGGGWKVGEPTGEKPNEPAEQHAPTLLQFCCNLFRSTPPSQFAALSLHFLYFRCTLWQLCNRLLRFRYALLDFWSELLHFRCTLSHVCDTSVTLPFRFRHFKEGQGAGAGLCLVGGGGGSGRVPSEEPCGWRWVLLSCP